MGNVIKHSMVSEHAANSSNLCLSVVRQLRTALEGDLHFSPSRSVTKQLASGVFVEFLWGFHTPLALIAYAAPSNLIEPL